MKTEYQEVIKLIKDSGDYLRGLQTEEKNILKDKEWTTKQDEEIENQFSKLVSGFGHSLYAEEKHHQFQEAADIWIVDPISYTFNFIHNLPHFAVVASHMQNGKVVFSCIYDPSVKELFTAYRGQGAFLNEQRLQVLPTDNDPCLIYDQVVVKGWDKQTNLDILSRMMDIGWVRSIGSFALNHAYVACGRAHGAVTTTKDCFPEMAAQLLVTEAGGVLTDFQGEQIDIATRGFVSGTPTMHAKLVEILKDIPSKR